METINTKKRERNSFKIVILLGLILISNSYIFSQVLLVGKVINLATEDNLSNVNIRIKGENTGSFTNATGYFTLETKALPASIFVSHIGFETQEIFITNANQFIDIKLKPEDISLNVFEVKARKPKNIIKNSKLYVIDYDFYGDSILLLSYKNRKTSQSNLVLINANGDTLLSKPLQDMDFLFKDCFDNEHIVSKYYANQIYLNHNSIELLYPSHKDTFMTMFNVVIENHNNLFYLKESKASNQIVNYYIYNKNNDSLKLLKSLIDEGGLERLSDKGRLQGMDGYSEFDARFEEMCFYAPKYLPIVKTKDGIVLFNFIDDYIEFYDFEGNEIESKKIGFHKLKGWDSKILFDEKTQKFYTIYEKGGIYTLYEIDMKNGQITSAIKIPNFAFVQNIKIYNGVLYFLYNDINEYDYKQLFCLKI